MNTKIFSAIPRLEEVMIDSYFTHFAAYVTGLRLLNQIEISKDDIEDAYVLIEYFLKRFHVIW